MKRVRLIVISALTTLAVTAPALWLVTPVANADVAPIHVGDACANFDGAVTWHGWEYRRVHFLGAAFPIVATPPTIHIGGTLTNSQQCSGATSSVWLSYWLKLSPNYDGYHNWNEANVTGYGSTTFTAPGHTLILNPGRIGVAVCTSWQSWRCGPTEYVNQ